MFDFPTTWIPVDFLFGTAMHKLAAGLTPVDVVQQLLGRSELFLRTGAFSVSFQRNGCVGHRAAQALQRFTQIAAATTGTEVELKMVAQPFASKKKCDLGAESMGQSNGKSTLFKFNVKPQAINHSQIVISMDGM